jgi:hypothetical protein
LHVSNIFGTSAEQQKIDRDSVTLSLNPSLLGTADMVTQAACGTLGACLYREKTYEC